MHKKSEKTVFPLTFQCNDVYKKLLFDLIILIAGIKLVKATKNVAVEFKCKNLIITTVECGKITIL